MYDAIDAEATNPNSNKIKSDKLIQTSRFILKDLLTPNSSFSSPPLSSPPDHNIYKPTPTPSHKSIEKSSGRETVEESVYEDVYNDLRSHRYQHHQEQQHQKKKCVYITNQLKELILHRHHHHHHHCCRLVGRPDR